MKKRWKQNNALIDSVTRTNRFKILEFLLILLALFAAFNFNPYDRKLTSGIIFCHTNPIFILLFLAYFLLVTLNTCISFYQYDTYLIRLKNKKGLIKKLVVIVLQINTILLIIYFIIYLSIYNLVMLDCYEQNPVFNYTITANTYAIYTMIKFYLLAYLYMIINTVLFVILRESKTVIVNIIYLSGFIATNIDKKYLPWSYYKLIDYHTFSNELLTFIGYLIIIILVICLLFYLGTKQKRGVIYDN